MNELYHYGIKRRSGRYPWGSGDRPYQRDKAGSERKLKYESPAAYKTKSVVITTGINIPLRVLSMTVPGFALVANPIILAINARSSYIHEFDGTDYFKKEGAPNKVKDLNKQGTATSTSKNTDLVNPRVLSKKGRVNNCMNCTAAMEMRARGFDVVSRSSGTGVSMNTWKSMFEDAKIENPRVSREEKETRRSFVERSFDNFCNEIEKQGNGARGSAMFMYEKIGDGGHSIFYQVENGTVNFYDGQNKKINSTQMFSLGDPNSYSFVRFDNLKINEDNITTMVMNRKR